MRLIDTHCHPQLAQYSADRTEVVQRCLDRSIGLVAVGTTVADSLEAVRLAERYSGQPVWAAVGIHPTDEDIENVHPAQLEALAKESAVVAIGECGLDYYRLDPDDVDTRRLQADVFEQHLLLAAQLRRPLIVHTRDRDGVFNAYDDTLQILRRHRFSQFVMHCYSGDWNRAEAFLELGGRLSFTGILTFPKSELMQTVAQRTPLARMMVETDAPFLAPVPHRGERNEPAYVEQIVEKIADLRNQTVDAVAAGTTATARDFFKI